ncbi:MAG: RDD family protein [Acidimicrobiaceae bacterium]|nr:RDD family protein [Acidimicrobiaceae bacterium]
MSGRARVWLRHLVVRSAVPQQGVRADDSRLVVLPTGVEVESPGLSVRSAARCTTALKLSGIFALFSLFVYLYLFGKGHHGGGGAGRVSAQERRQVLTLWLALPVVALVLWTSWGAVQLAADQQTGSRRRLALAVVAYANGGTPTLEAAVIRAFFPLTAALAGYCAVVALPLTAAVPIGLIGAVFIYATCCLSAGWNRDRRGWPDKLAGTIVVRRRVASPKALWRSSRRPAQSP